MLAAVPWDYAGFTLIVWTGFFLGILHTIMPCEDKFIVMFYAFGVARDWRQALQIVNFYGAGLLCMNLAIGTVISYFGAVFGKFIALNINRFVWNGIAAAMLIVCGIIMLVQVKKKTYWPHGDQLQELTESLGTLRTHKITAFVLGLLAGIPPCVFEMGVYIQAMSLSINYGWGNGVWSVFFFGIGTWVGLYPLTIIGTASGKLAKSLHGSSLHRMRLRLKMQQIQAEQSENPQKEKQLTSLRPKSQMEIKIEIYSKIEYISGFLMILIGIIFVLLALLRVDLIPLTEIPKVPWPFR